MDVHVHIAISLRVFSLGVIPSLMLHFSPPLRWPCCSSSAVDCQLLVHCLVYQLIINVACTRHMCTSYMYMCTLLVFVQVAVPSTIHCDHLIEAQVGASADLKRAIVS